MDKHRTIYTRGVTILCGIRVQYVRVIVIVDPVLAVPLTLALHHPRSGCGGLATAK